MHALLSSLPPTLQQATTAHDSTGDPWALMVSLGQSLVGPLLPSPGFCCAQGSVCALQESVFPVLCMFWHLYGRVIDDLFQEGL